MINLKYALKQLCGDYTVKGETAAGKINNFLALPFDYKDVGIERELISTAPRFTTASL